MLYVAKKVKIYKRTRSKTEYNKLVTKVDNIDNKNFVKKTDFNSKITEIESKMPSITGLPTSSALTAVENKIPEVSGLVAKTEYDTKISDIEKKITDHNDDKYITSPEFNRLTTESFKARLKQANLISKSDLDTEFKKNSEGHFK